jgi:hypothetical protein
MNTKTLLYLLSTVLLSLLPEGTQIEQSKTYNRPDLSNCQWKGIPLHGKVQIVDAFPDIKVQLVDAFPDIKVKFVDAFPDECGEWQVVESFPDFKVQFVESFPDIKIKTVDHFPGIE